MTTRKPPSLDATRRKARSAVLHMIQRPAALRVDDAHKLGPLAMNLHHTVTRIWLDATDAVCQKVLTRMADPDAAIEADMTGDLVTITFGSVRLGTWQVVKDEPRGLVIIDDEDPDDE